MAWWPFRSKHDSTFADGELVVVKGVVRVLGPLLESPLSGRSAVAYLSVGWLRERNNGPLGATPEVEVFEQRVVPFEIETRERVIRIDVPYVELAVVPVPCVPRQLERERAFVAKHGSDDSDVRNSRFEERCLEPGSSVQVRGLAIAETDPTTGEHGFRDAAMRFRIVAHDRQPVRIRSAR